MSKTALICGISGQDGSLLARHLVEKGYEVWGTSRDAAVSSFVNLHKMDVMESVKTTSMTLTDFRSVLQTLDGIKPDEVYNFAGQSSVGLSFEEPFETMQSHAIGTLNLLEVLRFIGGDIKLYNAASSECFGECGSRGLVESDPFRPRSPYAVAKAASYWEAVNYRESYGIHVCSGILFNHESPLRPERFVTKKIVSTACRIANGSTEKLRLGDLGIKRDWGWAAEYVEAMWRMMQLPDPDDYIIATGESNSLGDFVHEAFSYLGLNWQDYVISDPALYRPSEIRENRGDSSKASNAFGWAPKKVMRDVVHSMIDAELG